MIELSYRRHRFPPGCDPACRLALPALHAQLPRRRGSPRRARARPLLRNRPKLGAEVRTPDRSAAKAGPSPPPDALATAHVLPPPLPPPFHHPTPPPPPPAPP